MTSSNSTRPQNIPEGVSEERVDPVGGKVSYGLVVYKRSGTPQVVVLVAGRPITVPAVGETFELQGDAPNISGIVSSVNHSFGYVGGTAPSLNCTTQVILTD